MNKLLIVLLAVFTVGTQAETVRDPAQVRAFRRANPCPATGKIQKTCHGYVVDHIVPLACNGPDRPSNMQWQTVEEGKSKDKWERRGCEKKKVGK